MPAALPCFWSLMLETTATATAHVCVSGQGTRRLRSVLATEGLACDMALMTNEVPHPYSITVEPLKKPEGHFGWALRKHGKLAERSDRAFTSEAKAFEAAMKAIERNETGFGSR